MLQHHGQQPQDGMWRSRGGIPSTVSSMGPSLVSTISQQFLCYSFHLNCCSHCEDCFGVLFTSLGSKNKKTFHISLYSLHSSFLMDTNISLYIPQSGQSFWGGRILSQRMGFIKSSQLHQIKTFYTNKTDKDKIVRELVKVIFASNMNKSNRQTYKTKHIGN